MVTVTLSGTSKEDAAGVLGVLRTAFPTDGPDPVTHEQPGDRPAVWTADIEPTRERARTEPATLASQVTATVQGGYVAVDQVIEALSAAFDVQEQGTASGDQEKEVDLRLRTKG
ncbi:hypothetical protein ACIQOF_33275 [Streptomyces sp. NPDC091265]|uniref:hypothetical protein n=1 Tax=unclassified Streptomyces TaxID=2593676 RepID=UPI00344B2559